MDFEVEVRERLARIEQDNRSMHRRLDSLEKLTESIHEIASEMKALRVGQDSMRETVEAMSGRIEEVESRPRKHWESVIAAALSALAAFVAGFLLRKI